MIHDHFSRFGLEMHVGKSTEGKIKASKTECVFFTTQFFDNKIPSWHEEIEGGNAEYLSTEGAREEREKKNSEREDIQYDQLEETK